MNYEITIKSKWVDKSPITNTYHAYTGYDVYNLNTDKSPVKAVDFAVRYFKADHPKRDIISITIELLRG